MALTNKIKTKIFYVSMTTLVLLFVIFCLTARHLLEQNHLITYGDVLEIRHTGRANLVRVGYRYYIGNKFHDFSKEYSSSVISVKDSKVFEGKSFPVVYYPKFPYLEAMLIFPEDFEQFHVPFPDSIRWILPLMKK